MLRLARRGDRRAVNLAAANIVDVTLPAAIASALERHGLPADRLECEISEHTVMGDPVRASDVLAGLRALGVGLSLDVRSTTVARNLGLRVVAEGVETAEIMDVLAGLRCDVAQGYFISRPLPADELELQAVSVSLRGPARKPSSSRTLS